MKAKRLTLSMLFGAIALAAAQQQAEAVFTDGDVNHKTTNGKLSSLEIGDKLVAGIR